MAGYSNDDQSSPYKLGKEFGTMLAAIPIQHLQMLIDGRRTGNRDNELFVLLQNIDKQLEQRGPQAVKTFLVSTLAMLPNKQRVLFDKMIGVAWCVDPLGLLQQTFPSLSGKQLIRTLSLWTVKTFVNMAIMLEVLQPDESMQRTLYTDAKWRYMWQLDELTQKNLLRGRQLWPATGECPCWREVGLLTITDVLAFGSSREGVCLRTVGLMPADCRMHQASRTNLMLELGRPDLINRLIIADDCGATSHTPTGYVLLSFPKSSQCPLLGCCQFSSASLYATLSSDVDITPSEPALTAVTKQTDRSFTHEVNFVLSIPNVPWPSDSYMRRQKYGGCVRILMVDRIISEPVCLVAAGFKKRFNAKYQWRYSFSRQEFMLLRMLSPIHRQCLVALKIFKNVLRGHVNQLKAYYLKTAVLWQAEVYVCFCTIRAALVSILDYLVDCVNKGVLPCYFWPEMNLLATLQPNELDELRSSVHQFRTFFQSASSLHIHRAIINVTIKGCRKPNRFMNMIPADRLFFSLCLFRKSCVDRLRRHVYRTQRVQAMLDNPDTATFDVFQSDKFWQINTLLQCPLPDGVGHVLAAIKVIPDQMSTDFLLHSRESLNGSHYWVLDISWFFQPSMRDRALPYLDKLRESLKLQLTLPPDKRLPGLPDWLCQPLEQLTAAQLCMLYIDELSLLADLVLSHKDMLVLQNMALADVEKVAAFLRNIELPDIVDKWRTVKDVKDDVTCLPFYPKPV